MRMICIGLTMAALLAGCGKKAEPLPPLGYEKSAPVVNPAPVENPASADQKPE